LRLPAPLVEPSHAATSNQLLIRLMNHVIGENCRQNVAVWPQRRTNMAPCRRTPEPIVQKTMIHSLPCC